MKKAKLIIVAVVLLGLAIAAFVTANSIQKKNYAEAVSCFEQKQYSKAYDLFCKAGNTEDTALYLARSPIRNFKPDSHIRFGNYQGEDLTWTVLDRDGGNILLLCDVYVDSVKYMEGETETRATLSWENSFMRNWLNNTFQGQAFSEEELRQIQYTNVCVKREYKNGKPTQNALETVKDAIFLLDEYELLTYFTNTSRSWNGKMSEYLVDKYHGQTSFNKSNYSYSDFTAFLRINGEKTDKYVKVPAVDFNGDRTGSAFGSSFSNDEYATYAHFVRPAMWISLDGVTEKSVKK